MKREKFSRIGRVVVVHIAEREKERECLHSISQFRKLVPLVKSTDQHVR